jgi:hypothetical protein
MLDNVDVRFPFYGNALDEFVRSIGDGIPPDIIIRGKTVGVEEQYLDDYAAMVREVVANLGITDDQAERFLEDAVIERGPENWEWVQALLRAADHIPGVSAGAIQRFTRDVYIYLSRSNVRKAINAIVEAQIPSGRTVIVGHSLGSVVAYDVLRDLDRAVDIPLFATVGSPLGVGPILRAFKPLRFPESVRSWYNALDERDVIALHPLSTAVFPVDPPIENYAKVRNRTENAHGITGYLSDPIVAQRIVDALTGA